jgi:hypothetical protein
MAAALPIATNRRALAINQQWVGHAGGMVGSSSENFSAATAHGAAGTHFTNESFPVWQVWSKPQPRGSVAVLFINLAADHARDISISLAALKLDAKVEYQVTDVWSGKALPPPVVGECTAKSVPPHGSSFVVVAPRS